jgi:hypothetical protein
VTVKGKRGNSKCYRNKREFKTILPQSQPMKGASKGRGKGRRILCKVDMF